MKKIFKLLSLLLVITVFFSCSNENGSEDSTGKSKEEVKSLEVWFPAASPDGNDQEIWEAAVKPWEEEKGVKVNFQFISWADFEAKYSSGISTGTGPDIGYMYVEMFPTFIDAGAVEDLTPYLTQEDYDHYLVLTDQHKIFGKHYGIPKDGKSIAASLWYNKDILDEIGEEPPKNWEDIRRIVEKVQKDKENGGPQDRIGLAQGWGQNFYQDLNWNWYQFLWQNNTDMWDDDGKCIIDSKEGLEAAQFVYDMKFKYDALPEDTMSLTNTEAFDKYFMTGKAALAYAGANKGRFHDLDNSSTPFNYGFTIAIKGDEGGGGFFSAQDQAVLMSKCKDKELGMDFLRYITGGAGAEYVHKALNQGPTFKDEEYYGLEQTKEEIEKHGEEFARPIKAARRAPEVYDYLWKKLQDMMNGNTDPKATMEDVTNFANELDYKDPEK